MEYLLYIAIVLAIGFGIYKFATRDNGSGGSGGGGRGGDNDMNQY